MILLDTTILVYARMEDHALADRCRALLAEIEAGGVSATTTVEVIQEFAHVRARLSDRPLAVTDAHAYTTALGPLVRPSIEDLRLGLALFEQTPGVGAFDAVLAASALNRSSAVASADRGFADVSGLAHLDPASEDFLDQARRHA